MTFKQFINLYDNSVGITRVVNYNSETIAEGITMYIADKAVLIDKEIISFAFYNDVLTVRVK